MADEKKLALLIDSDNVSAKYAQTILNEASKYGELTCKRVYGDWEKGSNGWHLPAVNNAILPVQQTCYIAGKNATDFSMIIDAMDLLYSGTVDGFVLVTSDSDFTRLAIRLREAGKLVIGIGEVKTPIAFTASCHHFSFLNQMCEPVEEFNASDIHDAVVDYVRSNGQSTDLTKIDNFLTSKFGNVDYTRLGYSKVSSYIDSIPELSRKGIAITMKKQPAPKPEKTEKTEKAEKTPLTFDIFADAVVQLAEQNPEGLNLGQLNSELVARFGKKYFKEIGYPSFSSVLGAITEVRVLENHIYLASYQDDKEETELPEVLAVPEAPAVSETPEVPEVPAVSEAHSEISEEPTAEQTEQTEQTEKTDPVTIKHFILSCADGDSGISLPELGKILSQKYGKGYLKELGVRTLKQFIKRMTGVETVENRLVISQEFIERTAEIERFVFDFARSDGKHGIKALSVQLKKNFPGFDLTDYGYTKISDFINAIDGVQTSGYYVVPTE